MIKDINNIFGYDNITCKICNRTIPEYDSFKCNKCCSIVCSLCINYNKETRKYICDSCKNKEK